MNTDGLQVNVNPSMTCESEADREVSYTNEWCTHALQELQAELEQRDADKQAMQKTIASLQQCEAPAGERPSEAAELLAARKTIANLQRALREVESASGVDDELAELHARDLGIDSIYWELVLADIRSAAERHLDLRRSVTGLLLPLPPAARAAA